MIGVDEGVAVSIAAIRKIFGDDPRTVQRNNSMKKYLPASWPVHQRKRARRLHKSCCGHSMVWTKISVKS